MERVIIGLAIVVLFMAGYLIAMTKKVNDISKEILTHWGRMDSHYDVIDFLGDKVVDLEEDMGKQRELIDNAREQIIQIHSENYDKIDDILEQIEDWDEEDKDELYSRLKDEDEFFFDKEYYYQDVVRNRLDVFSKELANQRKYMEDVAKKLNDKIGSVNKYTDTTDDSIRHCFKGGNTLNH